jgi:hypothetical protein
MKDQTNATRQEQMFQLIEDFKRSGQTRKDFCAAQQMAVYVFYYWQRKYRDETRGLAQGSFVAVRTNGKMQESPGKESVITVQYPNGVSLQVPVGSSVQVLRTLISLI